MEAIFEHSGKQFNVKTGDTVYLNGHISDIGKSILVNTVLIVKKEDVSQIGHPYLDQANVNLKVISHTKGDKIRVFKMKRRKGYRKTIGYRNLLTIAKVEKINN